MEFYSNQFFHNSMEICTNWWTKKVTETKLYIENMFQILNIIPKLAQTKVVISSYTVLHEDGKI